MKTLTFAWLLLLSSNFAAAEPLIVAHRGLLQHAPENTLANFRACLELRLGFEFDVSRTKDGHLVCIHDDTVNRTTHGMGKVADLTLKQLLELDAGQWFDPAFRGEKIPTIDDVLSLIGQYRMLDVLIAVDFKIEGAEEELVQLALKHQVLHRLLFIGKTISEPAVRRKLRQWSSQAHVAVLANNADEYAKAVADEGGDWVYVRFVPTAEQVAQARMAKKRVFIAGVTVAGNVPMNWQAATRAGVDAILTDYPLELRSVLHGERKK